MKLSSVPNIAMLLNIIAIVPTACGIETRPLKPLNLADFPLIAIVPTACGIETFLMSMTRRLELWIAIVPTACGIET